MMLHISCGNANARGVWTPCRVLLTSVVYCRLILESQSHQKHMFHEKHRAAGVATAPQS